MKYLHYKIWPPILGYMLMGLILFEYSWHQTACVRDGNEKRDQQYPAFRRQDVKRWRRWKFYPGALTIMPLRLLLLSIIGISAYISVRIVTIGHNFEKAPLLGCRARLVRSLTGFYSRALLLASCMRYTVKKIDYDYTQYLGPGYKEK